jgi:hypothetical protein
MTDDDFLRHIMNPRFAAWVAEVRRLRRDALLAFLDEETTARVLSALVELDANLPPRPKTGRGADVDQTIRLLRAYLLAPDGEIEVAVGKAAEASTQRDIKAAMRRVERFMKATGGQRVPRDRGDK